MTGPVGGLARRYGTRLRYPRLLALTAALFAADLVVPDVVPFVDEILLGLATALLATRRRRAEPTAADR
jgi:Family of unknown function (DUF6116)